MKLTGWERFKKFRGSLLAQFKLGFHQHDLSIIEGGALVYIQYQTKWRGGGDEWDDH